MTETRVTCDSCGAQLPQSSTEPTGANFAFEPRWTQFYRFERKLRLDVCPECADKVVDFIYSGTGRREGE